ncbi:DsrE family protein [Acetobacter conturbans]|nr:DsrE family protein [Acetobacter conturbans]
MAEKGLAFLVCDNDFNRLHTAFMLAASALAMNRDIILFATGPGALVLCREGRSDPAWEKADAVLASQGIATLMMLRDAVVSMNARLLVCETGLLRTSRNSEDLLEGVEIVGMPTFLDLSDSYKLVTF